MHYTFANYMHNDILKYNFHNSEWMSALYMTYDNIINMSHQEQIKNISLSPDILFSSSVKKISDMSSNYSVKMHEQPYFLDFLKANLLHEIYISTNDHEIKQAIIHQGYDAVIFSLFLHDKIEMDESLFNLVQKRNFFLLNLLMYEKGNDDKSYDKINQYLEYYKEDDFLNYFLYNCEQLNNVDFTNTCDISSFFEKCQHYHFGTELPDKRSNLQRLMNSRKSRIVTKVKLLDYLKHEKEFGRKYQNIDFKKISFAENLHHRIQSSIFVSEMKKLSKDMDSLFTKKQKNVFFKNPSLYSYLFSLYTDETKKQKNKIDKVLRIFSVFPELNNEYLQHYCEDKIKQLYEKNAHQVTLIRKLFENINLDQLDDQYKVELVKQSFKSNNAGLLKLTNQKIPFVKYASPDILNEKFFEGNYILNNTWDFLLKEENFKIFNHLFINESNKNKNKEDIILERVMNNTNENIDFLFMLNNDNAQWFRLNKDTVINKIDILFKKTSSNSYSKIFHKNKGFYFLNNEKINPLWADINLLTEEKCIDLLSSNFNEQNVELLYIFNPSFFEKENILLFTNSKFASKNFLALNKMVLLYCKKTLDSTIFAKFIDLINDYDGNNAYSELFAISKLWLREISKMRPNDKGILQGEITNLEKKDKLNSSSLISRVQELKDYRFKIFVHFEKIVLNPLIETGNSSLKKKRM